MQALQKVHEYWSVNINDQYNLVPFSLFLCSVEPSAQMHIVYFHVAKYRKVFQWAFTIQSFDTWERPWRRPLPLHNWWFPVQLFSGGLHCASCTALHCWVVDGASAKLFTSWVLCTSEAPWPCQGHPGLLLHLCMQMSNANAGRSAHQMIFESNPIILKAIDPEVCFVMIWPKRLIVPTEICLRNPTQLLIQQDLKTFNTVQCLIR